VTVATSDKADTELRRILDGLGEDELVEVLVYPAGGTDDLLGYLSRRRDTGDIEFNVLELAGCIALRAGRGTVNEVATRSDVARVTINPTFTINVES
jgi:hypothetical protein